MKYKHRKLSFPWVSVLVFQQGQTSFPTFLFVCDSLLATSHSWQEKMHQGLQRLARVAQQEPQLSEIITERCNKFYCKYNSATFSYLSIDITKHGFQTNTAPGIQRGLPSNLQGHHLTPATHQNCSEYCLEGLEGAMFSRAPEDDQIKLSNKFRLRDAGTKHGKIHP